MTIGERLRERRLEIGLSLGQVGEYEGVTPQYLSNLEHGRNQPNVWLLLTKLAMRYRTTTDYLLGITDDPSPWAERDAFDAPQPGAALAPQGEIAQLVTLALRMSDELRYALLTVAEALAGVEDNPTPKEIARQMRAQESNQ